MSVAWLVPTLNRPTLAKVQADFDVFQRGQDEFIIESRGMIASALRYAVAASVTKAPILRNAADDDEYPPEANRRAAEIMESSDIDVLVTGGIKLRPSGLDFPVCVPKGARYGYAVASVAQYGACGSGLFMRRDAVEKYELLDYDGRMIDVFIVLKAIADGAKVRFCRLNTYWHRISVQDGGAEQLKAFRAEKQELYERFGIWGVRRRPYETPANWDGEFA